MLDLKSIFEIDIKNLLKKRNTHTHTHTHNNKIHVIKKIKVCGNNSITNFKKYII
jgi:hypothetical protein